MAAVLADGWESPALASKSRTKFTNSPNAPWMSVELNWPETTTPLPVRVMRSEQLGR